MRERRKRERERETKVCVIVREKAIEKHRERVNLKKVTVEFCEHFLEHLHMYSYLSQGGHWGDLWIE